MNYGKTIFALIMEFVPWTSVTRIVNRYGGNAGTSRLSCAEQFRAMAFGQLTARESLRDLVTTLAAHPSKRYGLGFRHPVQKFTLADANESRDCRIWADVAMVLIKQARKLYSDIKVACLISGCVMTILPRQLKTPFAALAFASVVSMMPGIFVFKFAATLIDIYEAGAQATLAMLLDAVTNGTGAFMIVMAMTFGLIVPKMMIEGLVYKNR